MNFILQAKMLHFNTDYLQTEWIKVIFLLDIRQTRPIFGMDLNWSSKKKLSSLELYKLCLHIWHILRKNRVWCDSRKLTLKFRADFLFLGALNYDNDFDGKGPTRWLVPSVWESSDSVVSENYTFIIIILYANIQLWYQNAQRD